MKKYKILTLSGVFFVALMIDGCKNLTDGYSTDPVNITNPAVIASGKYLTGLQVNVIGVYESDMARQTGLWAGYFSGDQRQYQGLAAYVTSGGDYNGEWSTIYASVLIDAKILKGKLTAEGNFKSMGITQIMEAMVLGLAADMWGDVPYTQALLYPDNTHPKYDTQASIYAVVQSKLDSAITNLGLAGNGTGDIFLSGSAANYILAAHTLKARYYLHTRDYANALAQAQQGTGSGTNDNSSDVMAPHGAGYLQTFNTYYSFLIYDREGYMGGQSYAPTLLDPSSPNTRNNANTDETARFNYYFLSPNPEINNADTYDLNFLCDFDWGSGAGNDGFFGGITSFPIITYAENQLILAEAALKQTVPDFATALTAYNNLRAFYNTGNQFSGPSVGYASMPHVYAPYAPVDFSAGHFMNPGTLSDNDALLKEVLTEKYVAMIGQIEGWNDLRRTGNYLNLPIVSTGFTAIPQRLLYPQIELNTNAANVPTTNIGLFDKVNSFSSTY